MIMIMMKRKFLALAVAAVLVAGLGPGSGWVPAARAEIPPAARVETKIFTPVNRAIALQTRRTYLELACLIGGVTTYYWLSYGKFQEDWQFSLSWQGQRRRLFSAESPKLDSNNFDTNWTHALAGAGYYSIARTNGYSSGSSLLFSIGSSAFWEIFSEHREVIAINDMIFTSFSGPAVGEPLYQMSSYFSRRPGTWNRLGELLCNPFLALNNWIDGKGGTGKNSGPEPSWHAFRIFAGAKQAASTPEAAGHTGFKTSLDMETNTLPGYRGDESFSLSLPGTLSGRIYFDMSFGPAGWEEWNLRTGAVHFGHAWQSSRAEAGDTPKGSGGSIGFATAFEVYRKRQSAWYAGGGSSSSGGSSHSIARIERPTPTEFSDKISAISPLGAVLTLSRFGPRLHARWTAEVFGDFAMVNALAYNRFTAGHDTSGVKTTLLNWGYYYAAGMTMGSDILLDWRRWHLRGSFRYQWYDSIQGLDRFQFLGLVTDDFRIHDSRLLGRLELTYRIPGSPIEVGFDAETIGRRGSLLDLHAQRRESRMTWKTGFIF